MLGFRWLSGGRRIVFLRVKDIVDGVPEFVREGTAHEARHHERAY
jgi:hypothetical protein